MILADDWKDYALIDAGDGRRLERWGNYILSRPDPQVIWPPQAPPCEWEKAHAVYKRSQIGGGSWEYSGKIPQKWTISYGKLSFNISLTGFKHTGLFPEQAVNWRWIIEKIKKQKRPINMLNLFAYTGGASIAAASAGAAVCHVDASKGMTEWAKENLAVSKISQCPVRFIVDDVLKFIKRERRRNKFYDAIAMDPPSFGRGPKGEVWKLEDSLYRLVEECSYIMSDKPLFFLINSYTTGLSPTVIENMVKLLIAKNYKGNVTSGELGLPMTSSGLILPCGTFCRWEA